MVSHDGMPNWTAAMHISQRQQQILEHLLVQETASVADLTRLLGVSAVTIRHDLNQLAEQGRVMRVHGGARIASGRTRQELTFATRQKINAAQKQRIGALAATLVRPMESILLDASTTAVAVAHALKGLPDLRDSTVMTTGIWTALELIGTPNLNVVITGGNVRSITGSITGSIPNQMLADFHFHKVFLGAWGLTLEEGLSDIHLAEVELKRSLLRRAQAVIAVLDGSKFGRLGLASFAAIEEISHLVTDASAPPEVLAALRERGVQVLVA